LQTALDLDCRAGGLPGSAVDGRGGRLADRAETHLNAGAPATWQLSRAGRPLGLLAGLLAQHMCYGLTDAIALGAKPGAALWVALGLAAAMANSEKTRHGLTQGMGIYTQRGWPVAMSDRPAPLFVGSETQHVQARHSVWPSRGGYYRVEHDQHDIHVGSQDGGIGQSIVGGAIEDHDVTERGQIGPAAGAAARHAQFGGFGGNGPRYASAHPRHCAGSKHAATGQISCLPPQANRAQKPAAVTPRAGQAGRSLRRFDHLLLAACWFGRAPGAQATNRCLAAARSRLAHSSEMAAGVVEEGSVAPLFDPDRVPIVEGRIKQLALARPSAFNDPQLPPPAVAVDQNTICCRPATRTGACPIPGVEGQAQPVLAVRVHHEISSLPGPSET